MSCGYSQSLNRIMVELLCRFSENYIALGLGSGIPVGIFPFQFANTWGGANKSSDIESVENILLFTSVPNLFTGKWRKRIPLRRIADLELSENWSSCQFQYFSRHVRNTNDFSHDYYSPVCFISLDKISEWLTGYSKRDFAREGGSQGFTLVLY